MARAEDRASDDDGSDSASDSSSGYDSASSDRSSSGSSSDGSESGEEDDDVDETDEAAAKKQRVRADMDEMRRMMADMDAVKARLQLRFAAERQARQDRLAREDREREVQEEARRRAEEEALARHVEAGVQTDDCGKSQQQSQLAQHGAAPVSDHAAAAVDNRSLHAIDGGAGFADAAAPNKAKPAGLSLYDLVKASGFGPSRKARSSVRQEDPQAGLSPSHASIEPELDATHQQQEQFHEESSGPGVKQDWDDTNSQLSHDQEDSVVGGHTGRTSNASRHDVASVGSMRSHLAQSKGERSLRPPHKFDENSSSVSNSFVLSGAGHQTSVLSDLTQRRDHRFNAAALLSASKPAPHSSTSTDGHSDKTDEQREMEAIRCLLFGHR
ncbi:hypothetical protein PHYSODRAFT_295998 [Phytophthora sojae]|uniref:Uncharacterized protein n=1 Tax=Phytophthora sojae (strain P6497) TaxID=1094619 RepID=G4YV26_PHYSP|nr:hypothetical protein PHYSODRAFT_295998 [Phytophthora sojae]EGZ23696.1 hypothetical protein PHYSODRAFT_295998 [Phytophthora sojae]|eukprot:XP_009518984.1 hypothetical protein PHYSODRAFT_295998 [Phytophthora sojae]